MSIDADAMDYFLANNKKEYVVKKKVYTGEELALEINEKTKIGNIAKQSFIFKDENDRELRYLLRPDDLDHNID